MKHNLLNKITSLIVIMLVSFSGFSQTSIDADNITKEWKLLTTKDGIEVHIKQDKCDVGADKLFTYAYIKLVNTTTVTKTVEFNFQLIFDNNCVGCGDTRETKQILQSPASAYIAGGCDSEIGELALLINNPYQLDSGVLESINMDQFNIK